MSTKETEEKRTKTWSREVATVLFVGCGVLAYEGKSEELSVVTWPATVFGLSAFGLKQESVKNLMNRNPTDGLE